MNSLFEKSGYEEIKDRLNDLSPEATAQWGKMNVAQMLHHCQFPLHFVLGHRKAGKKRGNILLKWLFKSGMYNDKPFRKNLPTPKPFKVLEEKKFTPELNELHRLIDEAYEKRDDPKQEHPMFGKFTNNQWGKMQYKHLDHHLRQFGR